MWCSSACTRCPSDAWIENATIFYTLEAMGLLDKLHTKVFDAIHKRQREPQHQGHARRSGSRRHGVDVAKYDEVEKSFAVQTKINRARQMTASYKVDGVPMLIVNGKYLTSNSHARATSRASWSIVDQLVERVAQGNRRQRQVSVKRVFLTGASSGIGEALARFYAARGATLGLVARREDLLRKPEGRARRAPRDLRRATCATCRR